jgi:hypothetical protein
MITSFPRSERTSSIHFDVERKDERSATHEGSSTRESDGQQKKAQQTCNVKHDYSNWRVANVWRYQWAEALLPVVYQHGICSKVISRAPTCPAVSHNCSLTVRSSKYMVLLRKSIPIVAWYVLSNVSYINLEPFVNGFLLTGAQSIEEIYAPCNKTRFADTLITKKDDLGTFGRWRREICRHWMRSRVGHD